MKTIQWVLVYLGSAWLLAGGGSVLSSLENYQQSAKAHQALKVEAAEAIAAREERRDTKVVRLEGAVATALQENQIAKRELTEANASGKRVRAAEKARDKTAERLESARAKVVDVKKRAQEDINGMEEALEAELRTASAGSLWKTLVAMGIGGLLLACSFVVRSRRKAGEDDDEEDEDGVEESVATQVRESGFRKAG